MWINVTHKMKLIVIKMMELYVTLQGVKLIVSLIIHLNNYVILKMD